MTIIALIALTVAAGCAVAISAILIDWLLHRHCAWCDDGSPATLSHYLEAHTVDRVGGAR